MAKDVFRVADGDFSPSDLTALARIDFGTYVELMFPISRRGRRSRTPADAAKAAKTCAASLFRCSRRQSSDHKNDQAPFTATPSDGIRQRVKIQSP